MLLNAKQILSIVGGTYLVEPMDACALATGLQWDSREVSLGDVYVAMPGERVDGHSFVDAAIRAGALVVLVMQPVSEQTKHLAREFGAAVIEVANTQSAITDLASAWRTMLSGKVIALTGSSGKTTTKNLIRQVLSARYKVVATKANQNNELGVPKTILNANADTDYLVVEMGMRGLKQIAELSSFVHQDMGLIVNVGESHIELLGGRDNIARAKAEIFEALPTGVGVAFVNEADDYAQFVIDHARLYERGVRVVYFGGVFAEGETPVEPQEHEACARVWAEEAGLDEQGQAHFVLRARGFGFDEQRQTCRLHLRGMHNVSNACAAAAVACVCGMTLDAIAEALELAEPEAGRQEFLHARAGYTVINDAYNANPESMRASLTMFSSLAVAGRRIAVLGDMGELGDYALACHQGIGSFAAGLNLDLLIFVGELSRASYDAAREAGMPEHKLMYAHSISEVFETLDIYLEPSDTVLVKASHFMELNRVVEGLLV